MFVSRWWGSVEGLEDLLLIQKRFPRLDAREAGLIVYAVMLKILSGPKGLPPHEPL
jgi:hypothetical protein